MQVLFTLLTQVCYKCLIRNSWISKSMFSKQTLEYYCCYRTHKFIYTHWIVLLLLSYIYIHWIVPTEPLDVQANVRKSSAANNENFVDVVVTWRQPSRCNGVVTSYTVYWSITPDAPDTAWFSTLVNGMLNILCQECYYCILLWDNPYIFIMKIHLYDKYSIDVMRVLWLAVLQMFFFDLQNVLYRIVFNFKTKYELLGDLYQLFERIRATTWTWYRYKLHIHTTMSWNQSICSFRSTTKYYLWLKVKLYLPLI